MNWPSIRRNLILLILVLGAMSLYSLFLGRPGDFAAGSVGAIVGGSVALIVLLVEGAGKRFIRRRSAPSAEGAPSDEPPGECDNAL